MIYFIQAENGGPVKIGYTNNIERRLFQLQEGNPYELLVLRIIDGSVKLEKAIHRRFASCCFRIEWFYPTAELLNFIENIDSQQNQQWINDTLQEIKNKEDLIKASEQNELRFFQDSLSVLHDIMDGFTVNTAIEWLKDRYREDLKDRGYSSFKAEEYMLERLFLIKDEVSKLWEFRQYWQPAFVTTSVHDNRHEIKRDIYLTHGVDLNARLEVACS